MALPGCEGAPRQPVSLASSAQQNGDRSKPAEVPNNESAPCGGQAPRSKKRSPVSPLGRVIVDVRTTIPGSVTHRNHIGGLKHRFANQDRTVTIDVSPEERLPIWGRIDVVVGRGPGSLQAPAVTAYAPPACRKCRASAGPVAAIAVDPRIKEAVKIGLMLFMNLDPRMMNSAGTFPVASTTVDHMTRTGEIQAGILWICAGQLLSLNSVRCLLARLSKETGARIDGRRAPSKMRSCAINWPRRAPFRAISPPRTSYLSEPNIAWS